MENDEPTCGRQALLVRKLIEERKNRFINTLHLIVIINRFVCENGRHIFQTIEMCMVHIELKSNYGDLFVCFSYNVYRIIGVPYSIGG